MRIIFLRHPQTVANDAGYIYGKKDYPYTKLGELQLKVAVNLAEKFHYEYIITSPLGRARRLGKAVAEAYDKKLMMDETIEEMGYGILEGLTVEEGRQQYPKVMTAFLEGEPDYMIPDGESPIDFENRVCQFIDLCLEDDQDVLIVTHGGVIRTAIEYLLDAESGFSWQLEIGNGSFAEILCEEGYHRLNTLINIDDQLIRN